METKTEFPVSPGTVVEVTCSYSDAINEGSSQVTCITGTIFTFSEEPSCSIPGLSGIMPKFELGQKIDHERSLSISYRYFI